MCTYLLPCWQNVPTVVTIIKIQLLLFSLRLFKILSFLKAILNNTIRHAAEMNVHIHTSESSGLKNVFTDAFFFRSRNKNADLKQYFNSSLSKRNTSYYFSLQVTLPYWIMLLRSYLKNNGELPKSITPRCKAPTIPSKLPFFNLYPQESVREMSILRLFFLVLVVIQISVSLHYLRIIIKFPAVF